MSAVLANTLGCSSLLRQNCSLLLRIGKFKALLSPVLLISSVMTLFETDLLKPSSRLLV